MKHDYTALDAAILSDIKDLQPCTTFWLDAGSAAASVCAYFSGPGGEARSRKVRARLQVLRKAGRIRYQRKPEGWVLAAKE